MNKVGILGCGWLGMPLAEKLISLGYSVNGTSTSELKKNLLNKLDANYFKIDLNNTDSNLREFLVVDILIITIPPKLLNHSKALHNLVSEINLSSVKKIIYTSSISVYGDQKGVINEKNELLPTRANAIQIAETEKILFKQNNFTTTILRLGGLIGNNRHPAYHLAGKELKKPKEIINLIHLDDCIEVITKLIDINETENQIYNLVNPFHPEKGDYYLECCNKLNLTPPVLIAQEKSRPKIISSKKIINYLDYKFQNNIKID